MTRPAIIPAGSCSLPKRGLSRAEAAHYIGVGTSKFDEMVKDGRMPQPIQIDRRVIWDCRKLDLAFEELSSEGDTNPWDEASASTSGA
jgi:predicted DNA-binding transcriptional regulator AlpA